MLSCMIEKFISHGFVCDAWKGVSFDGIEYLHCPISFIILALYRIMMRRAINIKLSAGKSDASVEPQKHDYDHEGQFAVNKSMDNI